METQIISIGNKIIDVIQKNSSKLSEIDKIDKFLDDINLYRNVVKNRITMTNKLDELLLSLTWFDADTLFEEKIIKLLIDDTKKFFKMFLDTYLIDKKYFSKHNLFKKELKELEIAIDDLNETITDVEYIFFDFRKDKEITKLFETI